MRTSVLSSTLKIGSKWTLGVLRPAQVERIPRARPPRAAAVKVVPDDLFLDLVAILEKDIRASNLRLSQEPGISAQKVAGSVGTLRMQNVLDFPIHVSQQYSNWPVVTPHFLKVPSQSLLGMAPPWIAMPEIQFAGVAFGQYDLILALTTQCRSDAVRLEAQLVDRIPGAVVLDRSPVIRVHKHLGHILDSSGRGTAEIISMVRR